MAEPLSNKTRLWLYIRMTLAAGLFGIGFGYYLQVIGRVDMTPPLVGEFAARGIIIGAIVWAFELFGVLGPDGSRLAKYSTAMRFTIRIVAYLILGELGFWVGEAIFEPQDIADLFHTAGGKK